MLRLEGKKALVTGGSRGIGRAICIGLADAGADLVLSYASAEHAADEVVKSIRATGRYARALRADVSVRQDVEGLIASAVQHLGRLDILVNNAGLNVRRSFVEVEEEDLDRVLGVDLKGAFLVGQATARHMISQATGGSIITISSIMAQRPYYNLSAYQIAKGGIFMLNQSMALELAQYGIRVNAIAPGLIATDMTRAQWQDAPDVWQSRVSRIPLGRAGAPQDIVGAAIFLASDESAWMTGSTITIDGGQTIQ